MRKALIGTTLTLTLLAGCNRQPTETAANANNVADTNQVAATTSQPTDPQIVEGLSGRTARVESADGRIIYVTHNPDGTARMTGGGLDMSGRWSVANGQLCFDWGNQPRECWPYAGPLQPGIPVRSTSDRGQIITTTLQDTAGAMTGSTNTNTSAPAPATTTGGNMQAENVQTPAT